MMVASCGGRRERKRRAYKRNPLLLEELFDAGDVGAKDSRIRDHQWLMLIANLVRIEAPLPGRARLDEEHRLRPLDDDDNGFQLVENQTVAVTQDRAAPKEETEHDTCVRPPPAVHAQSVVPSEGYRVAGVAAGRGRQGALTMRLLDDDQNRKYRWASGSTSAGSLVSS
jgi:hypothetical protein